MKTQPEALHLADYLEFSHRHAEHSPEFIAAAELRRLYAEVDRLSYQLAYPDNFVKEPEQGALTFDGMTAQEFALEELYAFQEATGCDTADQIKARKPLTDEQREQIAKGWRGRNWTVGDIIDATEAAHGIGGEA